MLYKITYYIYRQSKHLATVFSLKYIRVLQFRQIFRWQRSHVERYNTLSQNSQTPVDEGRWSLSVTKLTFSFKTIEEASWALLFLLANKLRKDLT